MAGSARITTSGAVLTSGKPIRVFGYTMKSGGGGSGIVTFYDGTDATGTEKWVGTGNSAASADKIFGTSGKFFPNGCFVSLDANVQYLDVDCEQVQS